METEGAKNIPVFRCDSDSLLTHIIFLQYVEALELAGNENTSSLFNPTKASIKFDKQLQEYVGVDGVSGEAPNYEPVIDALTSAIGNLETTVEAATVNEQCEGEVAAESEAVSKAIEAANTYLDTQLQLQFAFGEPATVIMSKEDIASCLELEVDGLSLKISPSNIADYCNRQIASHQSIEYQDLKYLASNEATYLIPVASGGRRVVGAVLYTKIAESLENKSAQGPDGGNDSDSGNDQNEDKDNSDPDKGNSGNGAQNPDVDNNDNKDENNSEDTQKPENGADNTQQE